MRKTVRVRLRLSDIGIAAAAAVIAVVVLAAGFDTSGRVEGWTYLVAAAAGLSLALRRDFAVPVLLWITAARLLVTWATGDDVGLTPAGAVALYTVARQGERVPRLAIAAACALIVAIVTAALGHERFFVGELSSELALNLLPLAVADALRTQAARVRDLVDAEADARVQAERLRIARDLHDVVAHGLSTIAVQSGVAAHVIDRDTEQAKRALEAINATGRSSLDELRALLGVLRSPEGAELRPTPSDPDDTTHLLADARLAGLDLHHQVIGSFPPDASEAAVVAVHRILQEALTNVARHAGPVSTVVRLEHGTDGVVLEINNDHPATHQPPVPSTGVGIIGMRERAESLGGTLTAGSVGSGAYQVSAYVPYGQIRR